ISSCARFSITQQAAEEALKGFLYSKGYRALITHSVLDFVGEALKLESGFGRFVDFARELDRHYIGSRYPNFYPSGAPYRYYTAEAAEKCVYYAESILVEVRKFLRK
ncbi:MAG: HEPN domain-containing protein, partial [Nanopusillaceae archaeon]